MNARRDPEFVERMHAAIDHIKSARDLMAKGPLDFYLRKLVEHSEALLTNFCPFTIGGQAVIVANVPCEGGWKGSERHLCAGTMGEVCDIDYHDGSFLVDFVPHKQWYRDYDGNWHESNSLYRYCLNAKYLKPIEHSMDSPRSGKE